MFKKILIAIIILLIGLGIFIQTRSEKLEVSRSRVIAAPAENIFAQINDFRNWEKWSPWGDLDPNQTVAFSGPAAGHGAVMSWEGNKDVGKGKNTIVESVPGKLVKVKTEFTEPFESSSMAEFTFEPAQAGTQVTWRMYATKNFIMKAMSLVMDCENLIGPQFEEGLAGLAGVVE